MYRIRMHGRGGQGIKTASRILGNAFFLAGYEVQDAPRYGAERRGAPIYAYVRAAKTPIHERGLITRPDLVVVADDTLPAVPAAGVMQGVHEATVLALISRHDAAEWRRRLNVAGPVLVLPPDDGAEASDVSALCAGVAAALVGVIPADALRQAVEQELVDYPADVVAGNVTRARDAYSAMQNQTGLVREGAPPTIADAAPVDWVELSVEDAGRAAPMIDAGVTSVQVRTGLWRTMRPVIDYEKCRRCSWVCGSFCPDAVISVNGEGRPVIDYDHCKGCMVCVAQCPVHAIAVVPEREAPPPAGPQMTQQQRDAGQ